MLTLLLLPIMIRGLFESEILSLCLLKLCYIILLYTINVPCNTTAYNTMHSCLTLDVVFFHEFFHSPFELCKLVEFIHFCSEDSHGLAEILYENSHPFLLLSSHLLVLFNVLLLLCWQREIIAIIVFSHHSFSTFSVISLSICSLFYLLFSSSIVLITLITHLYHFQFCCLA